MSFSKIALSTTLNTTLTNVAPRTGTICRCSVYFVSIYAALLSTLADRYTSRLDKFTSNKSSHVKVNAVK